MALPLARTWVFTVNNRLSRRLTAEWAARLRIKGQVGELPRMMPLTAWLVAAADELAFTNGQDLPAHHLDTFATELAWTEVIRQEEADRPLLDAGQAARLAMEADVLMDEWGLRVPIGAETDEFRQFARWRQRYRQQLLAMDAEDFNQRYGRVIQALQQGEVDCPDYLVLGGFTEISPRFAQLLDAFAKEGVRIGWLHSEQQSALAKQYVAADKGAEWRAAAAWAAQRLAQNPAGRYAIVSANLENEAPFAHRVLGEALAPRQATAGFAFNVTVGRPLSEWPAVRAALTWLTALAEFAPSGVADAALLGAALLNGHCVGDESNKSRYAVIDARWRQQARTRVGRERWNSDLAECASLRHAWEQACEIWLAVGRQAACEAWMPAMKSVLLALGFPGERPLDSVAHQVVAALGELLGRYAALTPVAGLIDGLTAVRLLERAARSVLFQPQSDPLARLDVLGLLEAEGGKWDGMWILGLTDQVLPASAQPHPLLPLRVLKRAGAPRATPERERQWAEAIFSALSCCASEVVVSYPRREGERELRPSPLIAGLPVAQWTPPISQPLLSLPQEVLVDEQGPPLQSGHESGTGGADVLETQARNPMWAFVRHRLGGRALPPYAEVAMMDRRGQFLHRALEIIWTMLGDQLRLHAVMAQGATEALIKEALAQAVDELLSGYPAVLTKLESARAQAVLGDWLKREAQRTPFAVEQVEREHLWRRNGLTLRLRLDRLDCLPDGSVVVIDYKTGMALSYPETDWARTRPINLQLPLYASVLRDKHANAVAGLMLAHVHARQVAVQGMAGWDIGIKGVKLASESKWFQGQEWTAILGRWGDAMAHLADEYLAGYAANVAQSLNDLQYCDAMPFLRLHLEDDDG